MSQRTATECYKKKICVAMFETGQKIKRKHCSILLDVPQSIIALLHEWLGIFELPHKPNPQLPPRGPLARGVVIGGLARVVIQKFTTTSVVMRLPLY